mgnify:CR=1 FL=1|jgi:hypothetical protein
MATVKFYNDKEKTQQVYPEIDPDGNYPGVTVGLANNLTSPDGVDDTDTWNYRSTGGEQDISDGYANLKRLVGTTESSTIEESLVYNLLTTGVTAVTVNTSTFKSQISTSGTYNFIYTPTITYSSALVYSLNKSTFANYVSQATGTYTFTYTAVVSPVDTSSVIQTFTQSTFVNKVNETPDTYTFTYNGSNWQLDGTNVTMSQYGITTKGTETSGTTITVYYTSNSWYYNNASISMSNYGISTTGSESVGDTIAISYTSNDWMLNGTVITLADYGITITGGSAAIDDNIQIVFVAEQIGVIQVANPTGLFSIGLNQFDKDGSQIFRNYTINSSGDISAATGYYVIYFKCLGGNTYTIYNEIASSTVRVGWSSSVPTTSSSVTLLSTSSTATSGQSLYNTSYVSYYTPSSNGYLVVATSDIDNLCCHLTWSGYNDEVYETYFDYTLPIPYEDENGNTITDYGLCYLNSTYYDEINFDDFKWYKRTTRIAYSAENLATVQALGVPYLYDSSWIYYGIDTVAYDISEISYAYRVSDFGTEQFIGTTLNLTANVFYQQNLKDKLRRYVEIVDNKVESVSINSTHTEYLSAKGSYDLDNALRHILGLDVDTFSTSSTYAVGDYVVYKGKLWKCTTAVSSAGAWTGNGISVYNDENGVVLDIDTTKFLAFLDADNPGSPCSVPELYASDNGTYSVHLTYAQHPSDFEYANAAALEAATGIVVSSATGMVQLRCLPSTGNWEESYLFKAN